MCEYSAASVSSTITSSTNINSAWNFFSASYCDLAITLCTSSWQGSTACKNKNVSAFQSLSELGSVTLGQRSGFDALSGLMSDLRLRVREFSTSSAVTSLVDTYVLSQACADVCSSGCFGPGQHSCNDFAQLSDPYTPLSTGKIYDTNSIEISQVTSNGSMAITFWLDTESIQNALIQFAEWRTRTTTRTVDGVTTTTITHSLDAGRMPYVNVVKETYLDTSFDHNHLYFSMDCCGKIEETIDKNKHLYFKNQQGWIFVSVALNSGKMLYCFYVASGPQCEEKGFSQTPTTWSKITVTGYDNLISVGMGISSQNPSKVLDVRYYFISGFEEAKMNDIKNARLCQYGCEECLGVTSCKRCKPDFYFETQGDINVCIQCKENSSDWRCTNLRDQQNVKVSACSAGFYEDNDKICFNCNLSCETCYGALPTNCLSCPLNTNYDALTNECKPGCISGFYEESSSCQPCSSNCVACTSSTECTKCDSAYLLQPDFTCKSTCDTLFYDDKQVGKCLPCHEYCETCWGPDYNDYCLKCLEPSYKQISTAECKLDCGTYQWKNDAAWTCELCHNDCNVCEGSDNFSGCTSCRNEGFLQPISLTECFKTCPINYYGDTQSRVCKTCPKLCNECTGADPLTQCTSCIDAGLDGKGMLHPTKVGCVVDCPDGYWENTTTFTCDVCHARCALCDSDRDDGNCTKCRGDGLLQPSKSACYTTCPPGYWSDFLNNVCVACHPYCSLCTGPNPLTDCTACKGLAMLFPTHSGCGLDCPEGYWEDFSSNTCKVCHNMCVNCEGPQSYDDCSDCKNGGLRQPVQKACFTNCPSGYWPDVENRICRDCHLNCAECNGPDKSSGCTRCRNNFFLQPTYAGCELTCPPGYYPSPVTLVCEKCQDMCSICHYDANMTSICTYCVSGAFFLPESDKCSFDCPLNYYGNLTTLSCENCHSYCSLCSGPELDSECTSCRGDGYLQPNELVCNTTCPALYRESFNVCKTCEIPCLDCRLIDACYGANETTSCDAACSQFCSSTDCAACLTCSKDYCENCITFKITALTATVLELFFSKPLSNGLKTHDFYVLVDGEKVVCSILESSGILTIILSVKANPDSVIQIIFTNPEAMLSVDSFSLANQNATIQAYSQPVVSSSKSTYQAASQSASIAVIVLSFLNMNLISSFIMTSQLQLISYSPMGMSYLPQDLKDFLSVINPATIVPNILQILFDMEQVDSTTPLLKDFG